MEAWIRLFGMGACAVIDTVASNYITWIQNSQIAIPLHSQLLISIFHKMLRKNDSKEQHENLASKPAAKTNTNVINVVSLDAWPLSFYTTIAYILPSRLFKFFFATLFLYRLLG